MVVTLSFLASAIPAAVVLFFIRQRLELAPYSGGFLAIYFLFAGLSTPMWHFCAKRIDPVQSWLLGHLFACVTFIGASLLIPKQIVAYGLICALSGIALGADLVLPTAIISQHQDRTQHFIASEKIFAWFTFLQKTCYAMGSALGLVLFEQLSPLTFSFYYTFNGANLVYATIPCGIKLIALVYLYQRRLFLMRV